MRYVLAEDARPQMTLLAIAMAASVGIWCLSLFFPFASYLVYPLQLFATFIHEACHALAAVATGNSVSSLTVSPDTSGAVWSTGSGASGLLIASSGYIGAVGFGVLLIVWMRFGMSARLALLLSGTLIALITATFGLVLPILNLFSSASLVSVGFTVLSGFGLAAVLAGISLYASLKWANFAVAFLAVQCLLNGFFSLKDLFLISTFSSEHTDAGTMAAATGVPSVIWVMLWIVISVVLMLVGFRVFASRKGKADDSVFINPS
jgi:hypothetical protein